MGTEKGTKIGTGQNARMGVAHIGVFMVKEMKTAQRLTALRALIKMQQA
jgi:hypothetical protein